MPNQPTGPIDRQQPPFTADTLQKMMMSDGILRQAQKPPPSSSLGALARSLNELHELFSFAVNTANASKPQAAKVQAALQVLYSFFEERRTACNGESSKTQEAEHNLYKIFHSFLTAMRSHPFDLAMDVGTLMPRLDHWHDVAVSIAKEFKYAMSFSKGPHNFGRSNEGPVPRFVAAVVPLITGERPSVGAVGKFLKEHAA